MQIVDKRDEFFNIPSDKYAPAWLDDDAPGPFARCRYDNDFDWFAALPDFKAQVHDFGLNGEIVVQATRPMREAQILKWRNSSRIRIPREPEEMTEEDQARRRAENRARSIRRSRKHIRLCVKKLGADHMLTLSYRENMTDIGRLKRDWKRFVRLLRDKQPDFQYVAVMEQQDRGAYHLHVAIKGRQSVNLLRRCWYQALGAAPDARGSETPGQVDVTGPSKRWGSRTLDWRTDKLSGYMTKYLHKAFEEVEDKSKRYWHSEDTVPEKPARIWLAEACMLSCIRWAHGELSKRGYHTFSMWLSESGDTFWISGSG